MYPSTLARRAGRIAFGIVLVLGMLALAGSAIHYRFRPMPIHAWQILLGTWLAAFAAAMLVRTAIDLVAPSSELDEDSNRVAAFVMPAVGLALVVPLTLHAILFPIFWGLDPAMTWAKLHILLDRFDRWAVLSLMMTGPAHITFAALVGVRAKRLARGEIAPTVTKLYFASVFAACVPGIVFLLPPLIVALTGLPLLPFLHWMQRLAERERRAGLPRATAHRTEARAV